MKDTIGNQDWLKENETSIKKLFPETWTPIKNLNTLHIVCEFKLIGVILRSDDDLMNAMAYLDQIGILKRFGSKIRRNPESIFKNEKPVNIGENAKVAPCEDNDKIKYK